MWYELLAIRTNFSLLELDISYRISMVFLKSSSHVHNSFKIEDIFEADTCALRAAAC